MRRWLAWSAALCLTLLSPGASAEGRDPQDGPHADVRVTIHDRGVTLRLIVNMAFVDEVVDVPRESPDHLYEVEKEVLRSALSRHFAEAIGVTIDEVATAPEITDFHAPEPDVQLLPLFPRTGMRALLRLHFELTYASPRPPRVVKLEWSDYPPNPIMETTEGVPSLEVGVLVSGYGKHRLVRFTEDEPAYTWRSSGLSLEDLFREVPPPPLPGRIEVPVVTAALGAGYALLLVVSALARADRGRALRRALAFLPFVVGGGVLAWNAARVSFPASWRDAPLEEDVARAALEPLLANIYRAFDYEEEKDVYDSLAKSASGELLDALYGRIYESLVYQEAEGALARVQRFELVDFELEGTSTREGASAFQARARWQVEGGVYHWSHTHSRLNEYEADFTVADTGGAWRIVEERVLSAKRIDSNPDEGFADADEWDEDAWIDPDQEF